MVRKYQLWAGVTFGCLIAGGCNDAKDVAGGATAAAEAQPLKPRGSPPRLAAEETSFNFGTMDQQKKSSYLFEIGNEGGGELQLRFLDTTCGCTSVRLGELVWDKRDNATPPKTTLSVAPGDTLELEVTWETEYRSGHFSTATTLETNDPKHPQPRFLIEGEIIPYIEMSQNQIKMDDVRNNQPSKTSFHLYSKKLDDLQITEVKSSEPLITAEFEPSTEDYVANMELKSALKGTIKIEPGLPIGPFYATLVFRTNCEERPELSLTVHGQVRGEVTVTPHERISFGTLVSTDSLRKFVHIKVRSDSDVDVRISKVSLLRVTPVPYTEGEAVPEPPTGVEEPNFLKVNLIKVDSGKNFYKLEAEVPAGSPGGQFKGTIELETDHPTAKVIKIPVSVQVTKY